MFGNVVEFQAPQMCSQLPGTAELLSSGVCPCEHLEAVSCLLGHDGLENVVLALNKQKKKKTNQTKQKTPQLICPQNSSFMLNTDLLIQSFGLS